MPGSRLRLVHCAAALVVVYFTGSRTAWVTTSIILAAALAGESSADCMAQSSKGAEVLQNPEPGFFILGAKSYGKGSNFLIRIGLAQIDAVLGLLAGETRREIAS